MDKSHASFKNEMRTAMRATGLSRRTHTRWRFYFFKMSRTCEKLKFLTLFMLIGGDLLPQLPANARNDDDDVVVDAAADAILCSTTFS